MTTPKHMDIELRGKFRDALHEVIIPTMSEYEKERINRLLICIVVILSALGLFIFLWNIFDMQNINSLQELTMGVLLLLVFCTYPVVKKDFENKLKKIIMSTVLQGLGKFYWSENVKIAAAYLRDRKSVV